MWKRTKGKWNVTTWYYPNRIQNKNSIVIVSDNFRIAEIDNDDSSGNGYAVPRSEAHANAELMAAAPEMYDALEMVLEAFEHGGTMEDISFKQIRSALDKAHGIFTR